MQGFWFTTTLTKGAREMLLDKEEYNLGRTLVWIRKQRRNSFDIGKSHIFSLWVNPCPRVSKKEKEMYDSMGIEKETRNHAFTYIRHFNN